MEPNTSLDLTSPAQATQTRNTSTKMHIIAWSIYFTGILYYCYAYLLRVYPSVMELNLETHFHINATQLGLLLSAYYFTYAPAQLIVGPAVDRYGPRRAILFASTIAVAGTLLFTVSDQFALAFAGRLMIGLGAAFAYVTALKLALIWLPRRFFAAATGAVTGFGMIVAFTTDKYLTSMVINAGYRTAMYFCFTAGIAVILALYLLVRDKARPSSRPSTQRAPQEAEANPLTLKDLKLALISITKNPQMWIIGFIGTLLYLPATVFSDIWGIPYLENVYHFTPNQASTGILVMMIGWTCSSFTAGALSDIFKTRKAPLVVATILALIICSLLFYGPHLTVSITYALLFLLGVSCGPHPLCFTLSKENNAPEIAGTAMAFANFVIMMGGFIFQPVVGKLLDLGWSGTVLHGVRVYSSHDFTMALSVIPVGLLIAGVLTYFLRETYDTSL